MRFLLIATLAVSLALIASSCSSLETTKRFNGQNLTTTGSTPVEHINANTWGIYCFTIPLLTGSTNYPGTIAVMKDTVNIDGAVNMLTHRSQKVGASKTVDMVSSRTSIWLPFTFVLFYREVEVSANAVK